MSNKNCFDRNVLDRVIQLCKERNISLYTLHVGRNEADMFEAETDMVLGLKDCLPDDYVFRVCQSLHLPVRDFFDFPPYNQVEK
ncbi:MAG: hypothetical protein ACRCZW_01515 [Lactobacillaceae bacterium]